jgi:hypothetical protein
MNADKRVLVLSAFICVHRRLEFLFFSPGIELPEFMEIRLEEKRIIPVPRSLAPIPVADQESRVSKPDTCPRHVVDAQSNRSGCWRLIIFHMG